MSFSTGINEADEYIIIVKKCKRKPFTSIREAAEKTGLSGQVSVTDNVIAPKKCVYDEAITALHVCKAKMAKVLFVDPTEMEDVIILEILEDEVHFTENVATIVQRFHNYQLEEVVKRKMIIYPRPA